MKFLSKEWFARPMNQRAMVAYLNTRTGREEMCMAQHIPKDRSVVEVRANGVTWLADQRLPLLPGAVTQLFSEKITGRPLRRTTDIRTAPKIARRLACLQQEGSFFPSILGAVHRWEQRGYRIPGISPRFAYADTDTARPDPDPETNTFDGRLRGPTITTWTLARGTGNATGFGDTLTVAGCWFTSAWFTTDDWFYVERGQFLFDTSNVGSDATGVSSTFTVTGTSKSNTTGDGWEIRLVDITTNSDTGPHVSDFGNFGTAKQCDTDIAFADYDAAGTNDWALNAAGLATMDLDGISKFGLREATMDIADVGPTWSSFVTTGAFCHYADETGTADDPKMVTTFTPAAGSAGLLFAILQEDGTGLT